MHTQGLFDGKEFGQSLAELRQEKLPSWYHCQNQLAMHEERCKTKPSHERPTSFQFALNASAQSGAPPAYHSQPLLWRTTDKVGRLIRTLSRMVYP